MQMKKVLIPLAIIGLLAVSGTMLVKQARADEEPSYGRSGVVQQLAEKFNLNQEEVDETLSRYHEQRRADKQVMRDDKFQQAVDDGVITAEQKQVIIDKHQEMFESRGQMREEMQEWMADQGIDLEALSEYGCGGGLGMGGRKGHKFVDR